MICELRFPFLCAFGALNVDHKLFVYLHTGLLMIFEAICAACDNRTAWHIACNLQGNLFSREIQLKCFTLWKGDWCGVVDTAVQIKENLQGVVWPTSAKLIIRVMSDSQTIVAECVKRGPQTH